MATALIINPGSTSKKFALYRDTEQVVTFRYEETGGGFDVCEETASERGKCVPVSATEYRDAFSHTLIHLAEKGHIKDQSEISAVGVRVVAPGLRFAEHTVVDDDYLATLESRQRFAPLHIPPVIRLLQEARELLPNQKVIAVSDSAFHRTMPEAARSYSAPPDDREQLELERYGYHGLSVASIARRLEATFGTVPARTIVAHVGGGVSVTALRDGVSVETSMSFTPASGLMMSSRAGDLDAGAFLSLMDDKKLSGEKAHEYLHRSGGFVGVTGLKDMRLVLKQYEEGNEEAVLAVSMYQHQLTKLFGAYFAVLGGLDALVLTATAVVRNAELRALILDPLDSLGVKFDPDKNSVLIGQEGLIDSSDSQVKIAVLKTDELGEIARVVEATN